MIFEINKLEKELAGINCEQTVMELKERLEILYTKLEKRNKGRLMINKPLYKKSITHTDIGKKTVWIKNRHTNGLFVEDKSIRSCSTPDLYEAIKTKYGYEILRYNKYNELTNVYIMSDDGLCLEERDYRKDTCTYRDFDDQKRIIYMESISPDKSHKMRFHYYKDTKIVIKTTKDKIVENKERVTNISIYKDDMIIIMSTLRIEYRRLVRMENSALEEKISSFTNHVFYSLFHELPIANDDEAFIPKSGIIYDAKKLNTEDLVIFMKAADDRTFTIKADGTIILNNFKTRQSKVMDQSQLFEFMIELMDAYVNAEKYQEVL